MSRNNRSVLILVGGLVCVVLGLLGYGLTTQGTAAPPRIFYANAGGPVLFPHQNHVDLQIDCVRCHHELQEEEVVTTCDLCHHDGSFEAVEFERERMGEMHADWASEGETDNCTRCHKHSDLIKPVAPASQTYCAMCHEEGDGALEFADLGHNCAACHGVSESTDGVQACGSCHKSGQDEVQTCDDCHADEGFTPDDLTHAELVSIEAHACEKCHVASSRVDALHHQCSRCHMDLEKGTFFTRSKDDAESVCQTCHMKQ